MVHTAMIGADVDYCKDDTSNGTATLQKASMAQQEKYNLPERTSQQSANVTSIYCWQANAK